MTSRNPVQDRIAIAGVGTSRYARQRTGATPGSLAIDACLTAIADAGIAREDIDGLCGSAVAPQYVQAALGIEAVTWFANPPVPFGNHVVAAMSAIHAGMCEVVLAYHCVYRLPWQSREAALDPFRKRAALGLGDARAFMGTGHVGVEPSSIWGSPAYAAWAARYLHDYRCSRERLGLIAINGRTHAVQNDNAVMRDPLTMDTYLHGRMVREPLCVYDMDVPVDGADAFVITTSERARDLRRPPVLIHAATLGQTAYGSEDQLRGFDDTGQVVVARELWAKSQIALADIDIAYPYDGFSIIALNWFENLGYCARGEAGDFVAENWDHDLQCILIGGRVFVNTHGGSLSEGGTQGAGHLREAVHQLRGDAGARQRAAPTTALVTPGGFFFNSQGMILRR